MAFNEIDLMNVMNSEINRYVNHAHDIKRSPSLSEIDGDFYDLVKVISEEIK